MAVSAVTFEASDGIARITLNQPERLNALIVLMLTQISVALNAADADPAMRVIVLAGNGRAFCAGADLEAIQANPRELA